MYVCFKGSCRTIMGVPGTIFEQWEGLRFCSSHWGVFFDRGIHLDGLTDITSDLYIYIAKWFLIQVWSFLSQDRAPTWTSRWRGCAPTTSTLVLATRSGISDKDVCRLKLPARLSELLCRANWTSWFKDIMIIYIYKHIHIYIYIKGIYAYKLCIYIYSASKVTCLTNQWSNPIAYLSWPIPTRWPIKLHKTPSYINQWTIICHLYNLYISLFWIVGTCWTSFSTVQSPSNSPNNSGYSSIFQWLTW